MTAPIAPPPLAPSNADLENARQAIAATGLAPYAAKPERARRSTLGSIAALCAFGALSATAGLLGLAVNRKRRTKVWYRLLAKSKATPPDRMFGLVWPVLYGLSAISAWRVWKAPSSPARTKALGLWGVQLVTNAAWSPLFFGAKRPTLAMVDLLGLATSLGGYAYEARKVDREGAAWLTVPYIGWTCFAGYLNATVVAKNRGLVRGLLVA